MILEKQVATRYMVTCNKVNVRKDPDSSSNIIGKLEYGIIVKVYNKSNKKDNLRINKILDDDFWYRIEYNSISGWVYGGCITEHLEYPFCEFPDIEEQISKIPYNSALTNNSKLYEDHLLNKYKKFIKRAGPKLILNLENNQELILTNNEIEKFSEFESYTLEAYIEPINTFLIGIEYIEGAEKLLVNRISGDIKAIVGNIKISPDLQHLISYNGNVSPFYSTTGIQIINISNNYFHIDFENDQLEWGPIKPIWLNNNEIEMKKLQLFIDDKRKFMITGKAILRKQGSKWKLFEKGRNVLQF